MIVSFFKTNVCGLMVMLSCIQAFLLPSGMKAETVSQKEASHVATLFFNAVNRNVMAAPKMVFNGRKLTTGRLFSPFYVYNHPTGGFVIVSAENKAFPILAYSRSDIFDPNKIDPDLKSLLSLYANHIERIRYDSTVPEKAIAAWGNINAHIADVIFAHSEVTDVLVSDADKERILSEAMASRELKDMSSDIYTPAQWLELIDAGLGEDKNVVMGVISPVDVHPLLVQGRKGDMYRISFPSVLRGFYRLLPTEVLSAGEIAVLDNMPGEKNIVEEEIPFAFYDSFVKETNKANERAQLAIENALVPENAEVYPHGSGMFTVRIPGIPVEARVYNVSGSLSRVHKYAGASSAYIDVSKEPSGFYFAIITDTTGRVYGVKLYR